MRGDLLINKRFSGKFNEKVFVYSKAPRFLSLFSIPSVIILSSSHKRVLYVSPYVCNFLIWDVRVGALLSNR